MNRKLVRIQTPQGQPGFLGVGHTARPVVSGTFSETDPFIFLMDDILDKKDEEPAGGPHPHAGFETVSLVLEGAIGDGAHRMKAGDFQIMTAGSGVVHTETIAEKAKLRLLQLWLALPKKDRWALPRVQDLPRDHAPFLSADGVTIRLYSGSLAGLKSPVQNYTPLLIADIRIEPGGSTILQIPADYNSFLYAIEGELKVGNEERLLKQDQVGWLDLHNEEAASNLKLTAGQEGARFVLYAGKPTGDHIVSHGPFIADSTEEISRLYSDYRSGKMKHIATVPESQRVLL